MDEERLGFAAARTYRWRCGVGGWIDEAVARLTKATQVRSEARRRPLEAADLPLLMSIPDPRGPYRAPLLAVHLELEHGS